MEKDSFTAIVCSGGGCKIPKIRVLLETLCGSSTSKKISILDSLNPEEVVAHGTLILSFPPHSLTLSFLLSFFCEIIQTQMTALI
jgi:hypothetical protein